jgi:hypothetical protein
LLFAPQLKAQDEIWPELDVFYRFNEKFRLYTLFSGTQLKSTSNYSDGQAGIYLDYFAYPFLRNRDTVRRNRRGDYLWFRMGYLYASSAPEAEDKFRDHIIATEANVKFYLAWNFRLTAKNRLDWRISNGDFGLRYRPRLTFEHDLKTEYMTLTPYIYVEYYFNPGNTAVDRLRLTGGGEFRVTKIMNTEIYYMHQFPIGVNSESVDALSIAFKFYFPLRPRSIVGNRKRNVPEVKTETTR